MDKLKPKICPNCYESNKLDSRFCAMCKMILSYDSYLETIGEKSEKVNEIRQLKEQNTINNEAIADLSDKLLNVMEQIEDLKKTKHNSKF